jgi:ABC-type transporter Mla subunit MlaD
MRRVALIALVLTAAAGLFVFTSGFTNTKLKSYNVRVIFDDASFAALGEDVRIAGANVGSIQSLGVTSGKQAAVTISITNPAFTPFYSNATCSIRPQSLIGEEYVDCLPGTSSNPRLPKITKGPGSGSYYLPVTRTSSPIDSDIVQDISTMPVRESLAVIIDELGTGLTARGADLNAVIHRANPALGNTDKVVKILAKQNRQLAQLATDSDTVLTPLARERRQISGFVTQANTTSVASAQRAADEQRTFALFPSFLRQLRPLLADLGSLADQGTPLLTSLGQSANALGRQFANLTPFADKARTSLIELGSAAQQSEPYLEASLPLAQRLKKLGASAKPSAASLDKLLTSLNKTGGIQQLMTLLFNGTLAGNGFNSLGHYVRDEPLVSSCTNYATTPVPGCSAQFQSAATSASADSVFATPSAARSSERLLAKAVRTASISSRPTGELQGLLGYLIGGRR